MITEAEKERLRLVETLAEENTKALFNHFGADSDDAALTAHATGAQLATLDALFAIREGAEWRGITDPSEIARQLLREMRIGE